MPSLTLPSSKILDPNPNEPCSVADQRLAPLHTWLPLGRIYHTLRTRDPKEYKRRRNRDLLVSPVSRIFASNNLYFDPGMSSIVLWVVGNVATPPPLSLARVVAVFFCGSSGDRLVGSLAVILAHSFFVGAQERIAGVAHRSVKMAALSSTRLVNFQGRHDDLQWLYPHNRWNRCS